MTLIKWLTEVTKIKQEVPVTYGDLHLSFVFGVLALSCILVAFCRNARDSRYRLIMGVMFAVMFIGEFIKQAIYPLSIVDGAFVRNYVWNNFPFQLCSTPLYVLPFICFLPDSRVRDWAAAYIMTFGLLGGIAVYLVPGSVFVGNTFLSYHTMIHHGLQILTGVYTAAYYRRRINLRFMLGAMGVFTFMFIIANLFNTVFYDMLLAKGRITTEHTFNMFYISPRPGQEPFAFREFYHSVHPAIYIAGYYVFVSAGAFVLAYGTRLWHKLARRRFTKWKKEN